MNTWPGYEPLFLARSLGYYKDSGIRLIEFNTCTEVSRAFKNGLIDVAAMTLDEALTVAETQPDLPRLIFVCDFSKGADVLLAKPEFHEMRELKGKRIGVEASVLGAFVLSRALESSGMSPADVKIVDIPMPEQEAALDADKVDAVVTYDPNRSRLIGKGALTLFDSSRIPGEIVDVLVARQQLTGSQTRDCSMLISGVLRALDHLKKNPADAAVRMAVRESLTPDQFLESLKLIELPGREENLQLLGGSPANLGKVMNRLAALMLANKISARPIVSPLLDDGFVRSAPPP